MSMDKPADLVELKARLQKADNRHRAMCAAYATLHDLIAEACEDRERLQAEIAAHPASVAANKEGGAT